MALDSFLVVVMLQELFFDALNSLFRPVIRTDQYAHAMNLYELDWLKKNYLATTERLAEGKLIPVFRIQEFKT